MHRSDMAFAVANQPSPLLFSFSPSLKRASSPLFPPYKSAAAARFASLPHPPSHHLPLPLTRHTEIFLEQRHVLCLQFCNTIVIDLLHALPSKQASLLSWQSMESVVVHGNGGSGGLLVTELSHIKVLVRQLEGHLLGGSQAQDLCKHLVSQISSITERSISQITSFHLDGSRKRSAADVAAAPSPLSHASDAPFRTTAKKRKRTEKKRHQVRVSSAGAGCGHSPVDDGHSWRKYGQKEILGAKHPRGYYRCTHRHSQGCAATKQVQRTDQDPALFDVVYLGEHTCVQRAAADQPATGAEAPEHNPDANSPLESLSTNLTVKIEGLAVEVEVEPDLLQDWGANTAFCLPSSTPASGCLAQERGPFSVPSASENSDVSPATSDSNHVAPLPFFEVAGDVQFMFEEVMSACVEDLDIDIDSFFV